MQRAGNRGDHGPQPAKRDPDSEKIPQADFKGSAQIRSKLTFLLTLRLISRLTPEVAVANRAPAS